MSALAMIRELAISDGLGTVVLDAVDLELEAGEVIGLTGPSGSGKSTLVRSLLGHVPQGLVITGGTVRVAGLDPFEVAHRLRGSVTGYVPQDPASALNPAHTVRWHLAAAARRLHPGASRAAVRSKSLDAAHAAELDPELLDRRSWQLSGGQAQRALLAALHVARPRLVLLDEPTSGLDPDTALSVARRFTRLPWQPAVLLVSHSAELVELVTDRRLELRDGSLVQIDMTVPPSSMTTLTARPPVRYSSAEPRRAGAKRVRVEDLSIRLGGRLVVESASLKLHEGQLLALQGRSGSGKTSIGRALAGFDTPEGGIFLVNGESVPWEGKRRTSTQKPLVAMILQDSRSALNPAETVERTLQRAGRIAQRRNLPPGDPALLLDQVGLSAALLPRLPGELSGGQRQRVALARALASVPALLVCDEVTASLDPASEQVVLDTLDRVRRDTGLPILLITHSEVVARRADTRFALLEGTLT